MASKTKRGTKSKTKGRPLSPSKSKILRKIAAEIKASGGLASVGHSKGDHLSSVFIKN
jgi:hypothetical protein